MHPVLLTSSILHIISSCLAYARMVFEDAYLMLDDADGQVWADTVRYKMHDRAGDPVTEQSGLLLV
jgi:hypothetical protein